jgi:hypothetical protein
VLRVRGLNFDGVIPDALFAVPLRDKKLVGLVEADRGTERDPDTWQEKARNYQRILIGRDFHEVSGQFRTARVIVTTPTQTRLSWIYRILEKEAPDLLGHVWLAPTEVLSHSSFLEGFWYNQGEWSPLLGPHVFAK